MVRELSKSADAFWMRMKGLFEQGRHEDVIGFGTIVSAESPFYSMAKSWEMASAGQLGDSSPSKLPTTYQRRILIFDLTEGLPGVDGQELDAEVQVLTRQMERLLGDYRMPIENGTKTRDIFSEFPSSSSSLRALVSTIFASYVSHFGEHRVLRQLDAYMEAWLVFLERGGALGAHFHPGAWVSLTYYPVCSTRNSLIRFGELPEDMGGGVGIPKFEVEARPGRLIVFPGYVGHLVATQEAAATRISLAADLRLGFFESDLDSHLRHFVSWLDERENDSLGR